MTNESISDRVVPEMDAKTIKLFLLMFKSKWLFTRKK